MMSVSIPPQGAHPAAPVMRFTVAGTEIPINVPTQPELMALTKARLAAGEGFALATLNLDHLVKMRSSAAFRAAYAAQDLVVADGNPIVWLSKLARRPVALQPGSELIVPLAEQAAQMGVKVALLGATQASLDGAAQALQARIPGLQVVEAIAPPMGYDPQGEAARADLERLAASGAQLVFLALGAPKQEQLAARAREVAPGLGCVSIGAGLDFLSKHQTRAPVWVRKLALEWLWRMLQNPKRLVGRYAQCIAILPGEVTKALALRSKPDA